MALLKKSTKPSEEFSPLELQRLAGRRQNAELTRSQKQKKVAFWLLLSLVAILFIMWLLSLFISQLGDLVISIAGDAYSKGISISETADMDDKVSKLSGNNVKDVTNITYEGLPDDLDKKDGSYNGRNNLAYTFYITNDGNDICDVVGQLKITGVAKSVDEAIRIIVYHNGKPTIYAKKSMSDGKPEIFPEGMETFLTDSDVMEVIIKDMKPGQVDKFTIVSWAEGEDPECIDDIRGGYVRMSMLFGIADEEE